MATSCPAAASPNLAPAADQPPRPKDPTQTEGAQSLATATEMPPACGADRTSSAATSTRRKRRGRCPTGETGSGTASRLRLASSLTTTNSACEESRALATHRTSRPSKGPHACPHRRFRRSKLTGLPRSWCLDPLLRAVNPPGVSGDIRSTGICRTPSLWCRCGAALWRPSLETTRSVITVNQATDQLVRRARPSVSVGRCSPKRHTCRRR